MMRFANTRIEFAMLMSFEELEKRHKHHMTREWNMLTKIKDDSLGCVQIITDWYAIKRINLHQYFILMKAFGGLYYQVPNK